MTKPKICILIDWYLPGTKAGGPVRSVYSLVSLLKEDFDFYIITTNTDLGEQRPYPEISSDKWIDSDQVHYYYFSSKQLNSGNLLSLLKQISPDLIYLNSFWSRSFSINIVRLKKADVLEIPILLAPRGMLGKGALSLKSFKKKVFLTLSKLTGWYDSVFFHATQDQERKDILNRFSKARIRIVSNVNSGTVMLNKSTKVKNHLKLFYLSRIAKVKNLHFALETLKNIPKEYKVQYDIYGNLEDLVYWNFCLEIIRTLPENIRVEYKGELKFNEVQSRIAEYQCLLLPTLNENFGHSIVESLLCGCPVIISDQTPWTDLERYDCGFALSLNNRLKFTEALIYYAGLDADSFSEKSKKAINYISNKIDLEKIRDQYKQLFNESIKNRSVDI